MNKDQITTLAIIGLVVAAVVIGAAVYYSIKIRGQGVIKVVGIKAYSDPGCTLEVSSVNWGVITPGGQSNITLYLKSTSSVPGNLTLTSENYTPIVAQNYMTLTWNLERYTLKTSEVIKAVIVLKVDPAISGVTDFSFDIVIGILG